MASKMKFNKQVVLRLVVLAAALFIFVVFAMWARSAFLDYAIQSLREKHNPPAQEEEQTQDEQEQGNTPPPSEEPLE